MGSRTTRFCDCCGETKEDKALTVFPTVAELCKGCLASIMGAAWRDGIVGGKNIRPFCKACGGKGKIKVDRSAHHYDRDYEIVKCEQCIP